MSELEELKILAIEPRLDGLLNITAANEKSEKVMRFEGCHFTSRITKDNSIVESIDVQVKNPLQLIDSTWGRKKAND